MTVEGVRRWKKEMARKRELLAPPNITGDEHASERAMVIRSMRER